VRTEDQVISLGGPKQRAVLALLLLRADEVVPIARLVDEVWGDEPPASAAHTLEAYVSRLRNVFAGLGPVLQRQGAGYTLRLNGSTLDALSFTALADEAMAASAAEDHERCIAVARDALALWRGAALEDIVLGQSGRVDADRLDELRLRVLEQRIDAELALGHEEDVVGELQVLTNEHPYRERFVAQLMLALYRTGRHAHALAVYERTRGVLDEVGLQPSVELQQLSGRIVRQEAELSGPVPARSSRPLPARPRARTVGLALAVALSLALAATVSGSAPLPASASATKPSPGRIALVLPRSPDADEASRRYRDGLNLYGPQRDNSLQVETIVGDPGSKVMSGGYELVIWPVDESAPDAHGLVKALPSTKFVFVDTSLKALSLRGVANATAIRFAVEQTADLVGYLTGLVHPRNGDLEERADVVGIVGGRHTLQTERNLAGFRRGLTASGSSAKVLVDFANETVDRTNCERLANSQIDRGADIVFALAGRCGSGALAVARTRHIWGAGDSEATAESAEKSSDLLVRMHKEYETAMRVAVQQFFDHSLPPGRDLVLGLNDDYAVGLSTSWTAPSEAVSKMIDRCSDIRRRQSLEFVP
jgi:DNA-binding SARP family transcriptional activator/basic membrane lipoprotein Med (substrate-binding protein (PBP1-ABC) superfamily)